MKRFSVTLLLAAVAGCAAPSDNTHWNRGQDLVRSVQFHMLGWDSTSGQTYREFAFDKEIALSKTLQRHFWSRNPDNPRLAEFGDEEVPTEEGFIFERPVSGLLTIGDEFGEIFGEDGVTRFFSQWSPTAGSGEHLPVPPSEFEIANP